MAYNRLFIVCRECREATVLASFQAMVGGLVKDTDAVREFIDNHLNRHDLWPSQSDWTSPPFVTATESSDIDYVWPVRA